MNGGRSYTTKIWPQPSWIGYWSVGGSSTSMDPRGEPVISNWKRPCSQSQNGSEFPEPVAQNFRNPQLPEWGKSARGLPAFAKDDLRLSAETPLKSLVAGSLGPVLEAMFRPIQLLV